MVKIKKTLLKIKYNIIKKLKKNYYEYIYIYFLLIIKNLNLFKQYNKKFKFIYFLFSRKII